MATESVATNPEMYGAEPVHGNFTAEAEMHLWCANALSLALANPENPIDDMNEDAQAALRYLLSCEVGRAMQAARARASQAGEA